MEQDEDPDPDPGRRERGHLRLRADGTGAGAPGDGGGIATSRVQLLHPPLEGEGRLALSEAKCETGWGDGLSARTPPETRDCHPTPPLIAFASTLPLQGRVKASSSHKIDGGQPTAPLA